MAQVSVGQKKLRKLQLAPETTAGTRVYPDYVWRGTGSIEDKSTHKHVEEDVGRWMGYDRMSKMAERVELVLDETDATFEYLPFILGSGIDWTTASTDGSAGTDYIYTYNFPTTAAKTTKTFTIQGGDNILVEETKYAFVREFTISGAADENVMMTATLDAQNITSRGSTFCSTSVTTLSVDDVAFNKGYVYIDDATFGTTTVGDTLVDFSVKCMTGFQFLPSPGGQYYPTAHKQGPVELTADFTFEHTATAAVEKLNAKNHTVRLVRLEFLGPALSTAGATHSTKKFRMDLVGKWAGPWSKLGENNGNDVITNTLVCRENSTEGNSSFVIVNETASYT